MIGRRVETMSRNLTRQLLLTQRIRPITGPGVISTSATQTRTITAIGGGPPAAHAAARSGSEAVMGSPAPDSPQGPRPRPRPGGDPRHRGPPRPRPTPRLAGHYHRPSPRRSTDDGARISAPRSPVRWTGGRRRPPAWALAIAALAIAAGVLTGLFVSDSRSGSGSGEHDTANRSNPRPTTSAPAPAKQAAQWATANLPRGSAVVAGAETARMLTTLHRTDRCAAKGYVVADGALRRAAADRPELARCLRNSVPVARFADGVEVRQVTKDRVAADRSRATARADRMRGGTALLRNPAISASDAIKAQLRGGRLDLRAQAVLAQVAGRTAVRIVAVLGDPAELAAGLPARTVLISVQAGDQLRAVLRGLAAAYRPRSVTPAAGGARLTWPFRASPPPVLR
jgi:hypothetical protein